MGNTQIETPNCKQRVSDFIDESKIQIERFNPFTKKDQQIPYAEPLEQNIFKGSPQDERRLNGIIETQHIKKPAKFMNNDGYQYDEKFWKKQSPNAVIQGHWYRRVPHGLSKFYFPGGKRVFVAYFDHGLPIFDDCLIVFENGTYYHGGLKNFVFHGFGKYVNEDDSVVIEGQWRDGIPLGKVKEKLEDGEVITEFEGEIGQQGQKHGKNCTYVVKNKQNMGENLFEYQGDFDNGVFAGNSAIKTMNGKHEIQANFNGDRVQIKSLHTPQFQFQGQFEKNMSNGHGRFHDLHLNFQIIYQGDIKNGLLHGPGSIIREDNSVEKVQWHNGLKLKHIRNFDNAVKFNEIIHRIEQVYQHANTYTQMTKILTEQYKQLQNIHTMEGLSPKGQHERYLFEMISKEKVNNIVLGSTKLGPSSPYKQPKKEFILQLDRGKFLYVTCFKIHPDTVKTS